MNEVYLYVVCILLKEGKTIFTNGFIKENYAVHAMESISENRNSSPYFRENRYRSSEIEAMFIMKIFY